MTKYFCDKCKTEIKYPLMLDLRLAPDDTGNAIQEKRYELCSQCAKFIQQTIELNR